MQRLAALLQRAPWIVVLGRIVWRWRQPKFSAGVVGVVFNMKDEVLLVKHVFHPHTPWGLPGGWVDRGENPDQTVVREMKEELQLAVQAGPIVMVEVGFGNHLDFAYLCFSNATVGKLSHELLDHQWCEVSDLPRLQRFHYEALQKAIRLKQLYALTGDDDDFPNTK
jgi:8-oxo-dGTP diphosphatase